MNGGEVSALLAPLSEKETADVLEKLWALLARQAERYTMGESTSIPRETAEELLKSICFTLQFEMECAGASCRELLHNDLLTMHRRGQAHLEEKRKRLLTVWAEVRRLAEKRGRSAVMQDLALIEQFFRQYDLYFFAHRTPLDFGLPLWSAANSGLRGISCVEQCLKECVSSLVQN